MAMRSIHTDSEVVAYEAVRTAMNGEPYTISLTDTAEVRAVIEAVNQGIDSHLEACYCPERGDRYEGGTRKAGTLMLRRTLECCVSVESLPTLLRRLFDLKADDELMDAASSLARDILTTLGFDELGRFVGREVLGLE
jgi:hypothetical protein